MVERKAAFAGAGEGGLARQKVIFKSIPNKCSKVGISICPPKAINDFPLIPGITTMYGTLQHGIVVTRPCLKFY